MKNPGKALISVFIIAAFTFAAPFVSAADAPEYKQEYNIDGPDKPIKPMRQKDEVIREGEQLTLLRCIETAVKNQPNVMAATNTAYAVESRVGQAEANYYPRVDLSSGYTRTSPASGSTNSFAGAGAFDQYTASAALRQNIYDFGKTSSKVGVERHNMDASRADIENVLIQVVFNVKQAYYTLLQNIRNRDVARETVGQFKAHLEQARGFYEAGTKPKFDVTKAEVDLSNARVNLIKAENAVKIAKVNLNNAMGVPNAPEYSVEDSLQFEKYEITLEDAMARAFDARPDIKSIISRKKSAQKSLALSESGYYPAITGNAEYNWAGEEFPLQDGWNVGATVVFPLFSGFLTKYQVRESRANIDVTSANEELLRQNVISEVEQAYLFLKEAQETVPAAELALKQAGENLEIANGRYSAGVGNPIEVTDAQVLYSNARTAFIQSLSDYNIARASLEKAMGGR